MTNPNPKYNKKKKKRDYHVLCSLWPLFISFVFVVLPPFMFNMSQRLRGTLMAFEYSCIISVSFYFSESSSVFCYHLKTIGSRINIYIDETG